MLYTAALCALNAKYIHASLAPWCLSAGVQAYQEAQPHGSTALDAHVVEGTINEPAADVLARILAVHPQAVTFSCYLWNIEETLSLAAALKAQDARIVTILGGPEVSYHAAEVLRAHPQVDCILSGEGETSVPALLALLAAGRTLPKAWGTAEKAACAAAEQPSAAVPTVQEGVSGDAGCTKCENSSGFIQPGEVDGLCTRTFVSPPCVLSGSTANPYTPEYLAQLHGRIAYLETSRGCPYSCAFCLSGRCGKPRYFSLEKSFENILLLSNSGTQTVKFIDRTFNANPAHANAILQFILDNYGAKIPAGVCFHFELAGDILQEETFALLAQMPVGAVQLEIGMQSFNEKTLAAVRRKTNTERLKHNIRRLIAMENMHIHIDLIAGLPYEDLHTFGQSFDTGYALGANMLQLGFLKLLHGAAMREEPEQFPCVFCQTPPYEVERTPWLAPEDLHTLTLCEDALERIYNSGRFRETAAYAIAASGQTPFAFYCAVGRAAEAQALGTHHVTLDAYTAFLYGALAAMPGIEKMPLRDAMVCDRLATNATGRLPAALHIADGNLEKAVKALAQNPATAPLPQTRRGVALLYGAKQVCFVDYTQKNRVTGRYLLHVLSVDKVLPK